MICRQGITINDTVGTASDTTLANLASRHPLLVVHKLMRERPLNRSKGVVSSSLIPKLRVIPGGYPNVWFYAPIPRSKERSTDYFAMDRDDTLTREQIHGHTDRKFVLPA
jgi:hypothetical protein